MALNQRTIARLQTLVAAQAPIDGVSVGTFGVSASVRIDFQAAATAPQRTAAQAVVSGFDWSDAATLAYEDTLQPNFVTLRQNAAAAVQTNTAYLAIVSPTNADRFAELDALARQMNQVIRYLGNLA